MYEVILITHIVTMVASLVLMSGALLLGAIGKKLAVKVATSGMYVTILGFLTGVGLLIGAPLTVKCAVLTVYLLGFTAIYHIGFGFGRIEKARFVRQTQA